MSWLGDLFGGGNNQTTQSTSVEPYSKSKPLLNRALQDALSAYKGGFGSNVYTGSTVIPYSKQTMWGMNKLQNLANKNDGSSSAFQKQLQSIMNNGGFNSTQRNAMSGMQGVASDVDSYTNYLRNNGGLNYQARQGLGSVNDALSGVSSYVDNLRKSGGLTQAQTKDLGAMRGATNNVSSLLSMLGSNGLNSQQENSLRTMNDATGTVSNLLNQVGKTGGLSGAQNDAMNYYKGIAGSKFDYSPDFQKVLDAGLQDAREGVNANASAAGRYGSGVAQGVMTRELGNLSNTARLGEYRDWQNRKDSANTNMANLGQTGLGNISNLSQLQSGLGNASAQLSQQGINNRSSLNQIQSGLGNAALQAANTGTQNLQNLYGLQGNLGNMAASIGQQGTQNLQNMYGLQNSINSSLFNAGQAGLGNMQSAYNTAQLPAQTLMQLGGMNEDLAGRIKNDELRIFDSKNQSPWDAIGRLMQVANLGGSYTTQNTTSQTPGQNPFMNALGLGLGGLSLFG